MRAYMSEVGTTIVQRHGNLEEATRYTMGEDSYIEAEHILAETEPGADITNLLHIERIQGAGRPDGKGPTHGNDATFALAGALAAFVADSSLEGVQR